MQHRPPEYDIWSAMIQRCHNPKNRQYSLYGGRGIHVCGAWRKSFRRFINDVGKRPTRQHSLDRLNNDGNYEPTNAAWRTAHEQANNTRKNAWLTHDGRTLTIAQWAVEMNLPVHTLYSRIRLGWSPARALTEPTPGRFRMLALDGRSMSLADWERHMNLPKGTITCRLKYGWTERAAVTTKLMNSSNSERVAVVIHRENLC